MTMAVNAMNTSKPLQGDDLKNELIEQLSSWLEEKGIDKEHSDCVSFAEGILDAVLSEIPLSSIERHVPLETFARVKQGLMTLPLAPEYELHCLVCETCRENYDHVRKHRGDVETISTCDDHAKWQMLARTGGLYRNKLLEALKSSKRIFAVAGELISDVFNDELCSAIKEYAQNGGEFSIIAGPMIEKDESTGSNPFLDLVNSGCKGVNFYVADRRQELHFAFSDSIGIIYLEAPHKSLDMERQYLDEGEENSFGYALYIDERYHAAFTSPDVRPYRKKSDVLLEDGKSLRNLSEASAKSGLARFGKYGILAQKELIPA